MTDDVVIVEAKRTPIGGFLGELSEVPSTTLGAHVISTCKDAIPSTQVDEVIMGCVLPAGLGQAPARQASLGADLPTSVGATTINKVCGSGMKAVMLANDLIKVGSAKTIIAGGMESMSGAPYLLPKARTGFRFGHKNTLDHMMLDGLENAYDGVSMGCFAQAIADQEQFTREQMDAFAIASLSKSQRASSAGYFESEIAPLRVKTRRSDKIVKQDEGPQNANIDKIPLLKPAFKKDGTITAANASSISDGAAALVLMSREHAIAQNLTPLATIRAHATNALKPEEFTIAPVGAIENVIKKAGWSIDNIDLFEINEAFAVVTMLAIKNLRIPEERVNIHGGACALGHPIGASGARIIVTLLHALTRTGGKRGVASLCIGGGEATAIAIEINNEGVLT